MRKKPFAPLDALAAEAGAPLRLAKERVPKLVAEGIASLAATPRSSLAHLLVRVSPSSTAAARHALDAFEGALVRAFVPERGEATLVDAEVLGATDAMRAAALDVPGVASVEALGVSAAWRDDAGLDALVKRAFSDAS